MGVVYFSKAYSVSLGIELKAFYTQVRRLDITESVITPVSQYAVWSRWKKNAPAHFLEIDNLLSPLNSQHSHQTRPLDQNIELRMCVPLITLNLLC